MKSTTTFRIFTATALLLLIALPCASVILQQGESVRGLFVKTRPDNQKSDNRKTDNQTASTGRLALGYTLYLRDSANQPVRVDPLHRFADGEAMRVVVEPNSDGYLYIFDREGSGPVQMIFPDLRLRNGDARLAAHLPLQIPGGSTEKDWFAFTGQPQAERLILVFSREPVAGWPRGRELLQHPRGFQSSWDQFIEKASFSSKQNIEKTTRDDGKPLSAGERASLSRGLTLLRDDPLPSVIEAGDEKAGMIVVYVELLRR
ncbi:MAG: DUF4384 domain-containing protein [Blastocatellia bacterium]